ncbi:hypothetical protein [Myxococcus sp. Y35]|uniref:hypothetical protein n=1 Tax=Pseudomyxococcus flavus TaxID=3115648 RepID=UPI003CF024D4
MMNRMKWLAGVAVLLTGVACGPMEAGEEPKPDTEADIPEVNDVNDVNAASTVPCLTQCLLELQSCLPPCLDSGANTYCVTYCVNTYTACTAACVL